MSRMYSTILLLFLSVQYGLPQDLECSVPEPSTRMMILNQNFNTLEVIANSSMLNHSLKTYIVVHGWYEWPSRKDNLNLARALLKVNETNVLLLDYSKWSRKFYNCAYAMVQEAGGALFEFIVNGVNNNSIALDNLHLIGHSLGGHVIGYAGREVQKRLGAKVHRITALDPAGPLFTMPFTFDTSLTLRKTDARVVDVLHTTTLIGTRLSLGTVDFYAESPFEGMQPACLDHLNPMGCSHSISRKYYMESIHSCGIKAVKYESYLKSKVSEEEDIVVFGHNMPVNTTGEFSFVASNNQPYGKYPIKCGPQLHVDSIFL